MADTETDQPNALALFDAPTDGGGRTGPGPTQRLLAEALAKATESGAVMVPEDSGLIGAAMVAARALDTADRVGGLKGGYLVAQLLTPYRETLHALRLPAEVAPAEQPRPLGSGEAAADLSSFLGDTFGTPGD